MYSDLENHFHCQFTIAAENVGHLHLPWGVTVRCKEFRRTHKYVYTPRPRGFNVEQVQAVEELYSVRSFFWRGCSHRVDDDCRFLVLELVDGAHSRLRQPFLYLEHLCVVQRDNEDVVMGD